MSSDIYTFLLTEGFLNRECDLKEKKIIQNKKKNHYKIKKKIFFDIDKLEEKDENIITLKNQIMNNNFIDSLFLKNDYDYITFLKNKYRYDLEDYIYIDTNINNMILGGYIKYITLNEELKWGGILIKIDNINKLTKMKLILKNNNKLWNIKFKNFYIFYKKNVSKNDKFRDLFILNANLK